MDKMRPPMAKILVHSEGLGTPHAELVRRRAQEIAIINGRTEFTESDWHQAKLELHSSNGGDEQASEEMGMASMVSEADMVAADVGHHTSRVPMEDERNMVEELWQEGMEEAEHERMLQACKEMNEKEEE
jgi:hypothetical protein